MTELTMLAEMMNRDLDTAVRELAELNITRLDLKNHIFDRAIEDLDDARRERLATVLDRTGASVYCFASTLGHRNVSDVGEHAFRTSLEAGIDNMVATAAWVRPAKVRLLACGFDERADYADATTFLDEQAPWVYDAYRDAIDQIEAAGLAATIENEPYTVLSNPEETVEFFARLDRPRARFTWDIQNMWQSGTYPSVDAYLALRPVTDYVHLKGGRASPEAPRALAFRCPLDRASWPVREVVSAVLADGISPVLCLNPSHGAADPDDDLAPLAGTPEWTRAEAIRNVEYLRATFRGIA
ncbi:MAG: sugar phosphate isomerase/epimerase family protein [Thermomicrobiales bacterium]